MLSNDDSFDAFEDLTLDQLIELLVKKTTDYVELMKHKNVDAIKLKDIKIELDDLHLIIFNRKTAN